MDTINPPPLLGSPVDLTTDERGDLIRRFGNFAKDVPFLDAPILIPPVTLDTQSDVVGGLMQAAGTDFLAIDARFGNVLLPNGHLTKFERLTARSGQNSRHGVFFGTLDIGAPIDVAVKVFDNSTRGTTREAIEEYAKTQIAMGKGFRGFVPLAIGRYFGTTYSVWELTDGISTLDSLDWSDFGANPERNPGMRNLLGGAACVAADVHGEGWGHGDLYPRNVASNVTGGVFLIDWEDAVLSDAKNDPSIVYERAFSDLSKLLEGFCNATERSWNQGVGMLTHMSADEAWRTFSKHFLGTYVTRRQKKVGGTTEDIPELVRDLEVKASQLLG